MQLQSSIDTSGRRPGENRFLFSALRSMLVGLAWMASLAVGMAAAPANDTCAGAQVIPGAGAFPYKTALVTNVQEATMTGDPLPACYDGPVFRAIWYRFTPAVGGSYTFSTGEDTATTAQDTVLGIFANAACGSVTNQIACNDEAGAGNNRSGLQLDLVAGSNYFVVVWLTEADLGSSNSLSVQLRVDRPVAPANDTCATAEVIPANLGFPRLSRTNETVMAGTEGATATATCGSGYRSVWFKFTPQTGGTYIFSTGSETATTVFDTLMVLYSSASDCSGLVEVACSANGEGRGSLLRTLTGGTTYYIAIHDQSPEPVISETLVQLNIATPTPPTVTTLPLVSISSTGAVLSGTVNPNGLQTRFWFEWGPTTAYNSTSQIRLLFQGTATITSNLVVTGFQPNQTYHFRMAATNSLGRSEGVDRTFVWSTNRPSLANPARLQSGNFQFVFTGNSRQLYSVESSTNLVDWTVLGLATETPADSGSFRFTHIGAGAAPRRFYRVNAP